MITELEILAERIRNGKTIRCSECQWFLRLENGYLGCQRGCFRYPVEHEKFWDEKGFIPMTYGDPDQQAIWYGPDDETELPRFEEGDTIQIRNETFDVLSVQVLGDEELLFIQRGDLECQLWIDPNDDSWMLGRREDDGDGWRLVKGVGLGESARVTSEGTTALA